MLCCAIHNELVAKGVMDGMQESCRIASLYGLEGENMHSTAAICALAAVAHTLATM